MEVGHARDIAAIARYWGIFTTPPTPVARGVCFLMPIKQCSVRQRAFTHVWLFFPTCNMLGDFACHNMWNWCVVLRRKLGTHSLLAVAPKGRGAADVLHNCIM